MELIYGKHLGSLADELLERIEARRKEGCFRRAFLIVPDARTLSLEQRYLQRMEKGSLMRAEILSFKRLALRVAEILGRPWPRALAPQAQALLLRALLLQDTGRYPFLSRLAARAAYLESLRLELAHLRRYGYDARRLTQLLPELETTEQPEVGKLRELAWLAQDYEAALLADGRRDSVGDLDSLALMLEELKSAAELPPELRDCAFFLTGFGENRTFSRQEMRILDALNALTPQLCVSCVADACPADVGGVEEGPLAWRQGRKVLYELSRRFPEASITALAEAPTPWQSFLKRRYVPAQDWSTPASPTEEATALCPELIGAADLRSLLEKLLGYIKSELGTGRYRYKDFALCLCDETAAMRDLPALLRDYELPAFIDAREKLCDSRLFRELLAYLNCALSRTALSDCCAWLRFLLPPEEWPKLDAFENYALAQGLDRHQLFNPERYATRPGLWAEDEEVEEDESALTATLPRGEGKRALDFARKWLFPWRVQLRELGKVSKLDSGLRALISYLENSGMEARVAARSRGLMERGKAEEARALLLAWNSLWALLDELSLQALGPTLNARELRELLIRASASPYTGAVPSLQDEIYVGNPHTALSQRPACLILVTPTEKLFPGRMPRRGILSELDYLKLEDLGHLPLPREPAEAPFEDSFFSYQLLAAAQNKLVLGFVSATAEPSQVFWPLLGLRSAEEVKRRAAEREREQERLRLYGRPQRRRFFIQVMRGTLEEGGAGALLSKHELADLARSEAEWVARLAETQLASAAAEELQTLRLPSLNEATRETLSVSRLERYALCPYSYFIQYRLGILPRPERRVEQSQSGQFRHALLEALLSPLTAFSGAIPQAEVRAEWLGAVQKRCHIDALFQISAELLEREQFSPEILRPGNFGALARPAFQAVARSVELIHNALLREDYWPLACEWSFGMAGGEALRLAAAESEESQRGLLLCGKIDRVDGRGSGAETEIKIVDYKSYAREPDFSAMQAGLDLQLPLYLLALRELWPEHSIQLADASYFQMKRGNESDWLRGQKDCEKSLGLDKQALEALLDISRNHILSLGQSLGEGDFSLRPRAAGRVSACRYCRAGALCSFDRPEYRQERLPQLNRRDWLAQFGAGPSPAAQKKEAENEAEKERAKERAKETAKETGDAGDF